MKYYQIKGKSYPLILNKQFRQKQKEFIPYIVENTKDFLCSELFKNTNFGLFVNYSKDYSKKGGII